LTSSFASSETLLKSAFPGGLWYKQGGAKGPKKYWDSNVKDVEMYCYSSPFERRFTHFIGRLCLPVERKKLLKRETGKFNSPSSFGSDSVGKREKVSRLLQVRYCTGYSTTQFSTVGEVSIQGNVILPNEVYYNCMFYKKYRGYFLCNFPCFFRNTLRSFL
jgi:hypothetical protein